MTAAMRQRWNEATARERLVIGVMVLVVLCAVLFAAAVRPAWRVVQGAPATLHLLDAKVLAMRAQAAQLRMVPAVAPLPGSAEHEAEHDLAGPGATVAEVKAAAGAYSGTAGTAATTVNLKGVEGARFAAWLAKPDVQSQLLQVNLTRDAATGRISGIVVLRNSS